MKLLIIIALILFTTNQLKWDNVNIKSEFRGTWNPQEKYWTGALYECENQCQSENGVVCGKNQIQCCKSKKFCLNKYGMEVCSELVSDFTCQVKLVNDLLLKKVLSPTTFPDLAPLYD